MEMATCDATEAGAPRGVRWHESPHGVTLSVRAGGVDWRSLAAAAIALIWAGVWTVSLATTIADVRAGTDDGNPGPAIFVQGIAALVGLYCAALCLWTMIGSERLVISGGRLRMSSPWSFGALRYSYDLRRVQPFTTQHKDCGLEGDSCCCRITNEAYPLSFGAGGHRIVVFSHLPNAAKDWIRDRMNVALDRCRGAATAPVGPACSCGHDHSH